MSNPDVDVEDAMAVAQRSLQKANALERDIKELQDERDDLLDRVVQVELRTSEWTDREYAGLDLDTKVGMVREHLFRKATAQHGRAKIDYDDIMWEVFGGKPSADHAYKLMRLAANCRGFQFNESERPKALTCDAEKTRSSYAFSSAKNFVEGGTGER